jgi:serine phosphatase RsbU (regulator of sigma subunit)
VEVLPGHGVLLGLGPGGERTEQEVTLADGDTLLLYTDGLVERRDRDLDESLRDLAAVFARVGGGTPEQVCTELVRALAPGGTEDDVALLVLRCCPVE